MRIWAESSPGEIRAAAIEGARLIDYAIERPGAQHSVGDVHRGRTSAMMPGMAGAFVAIEGATGFLPDSAGAKGLTEGDAVVVRITRAAQGDKGPRLEALAEAAEGPVALLRRGPGAAERLAALHPDAEIVTPDLALAAGLRVRLPGRVTMDLRAGLEDSVMDQIEALTRTAVALPGGARCTITPTPTLVAIDVDSAAALAGMPGGKAGAHMAVNERVVPALAAQIRLRNLSGAILIDFAGLKLQRRAKLAASLGAALTHDPLQPRVLGVSGLGLVEILRPRKHPPLHELLAGPHAAGLAALRQLMGDPVRTLRASPAIVTTLQGDSVALPEFAQGAGRAAKLVSDPALATDAWVIE